MNHALSFVEEITCYGEQKVDTWTCRAASACPFYSQVGNETCCVKQGGVLLGFSWFEKLSSVIVNTLLRHIPRSTRYLTHSTGKLLSRYNFPVLAVQT